MPTPVLYLAFAIALLVGYAYWGVLALLGMGDRYPLWVDELLMSVGSALEERQLR